ncbi:MAG: hypothetical protein C0606_07725 [Hyphomicrobiales bacterium]|nr:MAG: hypothetical protein C0606_07725 [Hyphomicrobiales bacterium]
MKFQSNERSQKNTRRVAARRQVLRFGKDTGGGIAIIAALLLLPIMLFIGIAVDLSMAYGKRTHIQDAADTASLAVVKEIGTLDDDALLALAKKIMTANLPAGQGYTITAFNVTRDPAKIEITAQIDHPTSFLQLAHIDTIDVGVFSEAVIDSSTLEIALVLDNSGSMSGARIDSLKEAANDFVNRLFLGASTSSNIKIGIVPFTSMVNVGPNNKGARWLDMKAENPLHDEGFPKGTNRWDLYDMLKNASWTGCVEARKHPYDVNDVAPYSVKNKDPFAAGVDADALWVPTFAPDEPDSTRYYQNSYVSDSKFIPWWMRRDDDDGIDSELSKYLNSYVSFFDAGGTTSGPGFLCDAQPLTPLTNVKSTLTASISKMRAYGGTNMHQGVAWGWRVLSPSEPFTEGVSYETDDNAKILVLMSDGANHHNGMPVDEMSMYSPYNYTKYGRLGAPSSNTQVIINQMNARTKSVCTNAKNAGIKVITIAFNIEDKKALQLLEHCASSKEMAYTVETTSQLEAKFEEIAKDLQKMRIAY